jgi:hypothetical protein
MPRWSRLRRGSPRLLGAPIGFGRRPCAPRAALGRDSDPRTPRGASGFCRPEHPAPVRVERQTYPWPIPLVPTAIRMVGAAALAAERRSSRCIFSTQCRDATTITELFAEPANHPFGWSHLSSDGHFPGEEEIIPPALGDRGQGCSSARGRRTHRLLWRTTEDREGGKRGARRSRAIQAGSLGG